MLLDNCKTIEAAGKVAVVALQEKPAKITARSRSKIVFSVSYDAVSANIVPSDEI